jgi:hypothetical protein
MEERALLVFYRNFSVMHWAQDQGVIKHIGGEAKEGTKKIKYCISGGQGITSQTQQIKKGELP